jgi:predicted metal-dependent phosphoesterase TrpH
MSRIKVAIHLHTHYSHDSNLAPAGLVQAARRIGIDCLAITDHDEIEGAREARALGGLRVIVGEEISSTDGHVLGLFLQERIPPRLSGEETCAAIHAQGGLALAPHPFCILCENSLQRNTWKLVEHLDAVEVYNAQNPLPWEDARAARLARRTGLPAYVGMDAHLRWLPLTYVRMDDFADARGFLAALRQARLFKARVGLRYWTLMGFRHFWDGLTSRRLPGFGVRVRVPGRDEVAASEPVVHPWSPR